MAYLDDYKGWHLLVDKSHIIHENEGVWHCDLMWCHPNYLPAVRVSGYMALGQAQVESHKAIDRMLDDLLTLRPFII